MSKPLALYPADRVHCPECGALLNLFTQGDGYSLHTCERKTGGGACGQKILVLGAAGGSAVAVPLSDGEMGRLLELKKAGRMPPMTRVLSELGAYRGTGASQRPPPIGG